LRHFADSKEADKSVALLWLSRRLAARVAEARQQRRLGRDTPGVDSCPTALFSAGSSFPGQARGA